jgi:uncharacterized sporulation protein YeaH/YhbH (DUF444 family)
MTKAIREDWKHFRDVVGGRTRKKLKGLVKTSEFVGKRPRGKKFVTKVKSVEQPFFVHGDNGEGLGRGPGGKGDVVGYDPSMDPSNGEQGNQAGDGEGEGILISVDMKDLLKIIGDELKLPRMKPKPAEVFEEVKKRYNDISKVGPESLRHTRRTMTEAIKRLASIGQLDQLQNVPGCDVPVKLITPINSDRRYRQYNEINIPTSNAVIFFARDCSGSMSDYHCDVINDTCFWLDTWIRQFYKRVDRCFFVHDSRGLEVNEEEFYSLRQMGGTKVSSVFDLMSTQLENRYPPQKFNIYIFYFTDGDNWGEDNGRLVEIIENGLPPHLVNLCGITQIYPYDRDNSVLSLMQNEVSARPASFPHLRLTEIGADAKMGWGRAPSITPEDRDTQIVDAIRNLLKEKETA